MHYRNKYYPVIFNNKNFRKDKFTDKYFEESKKKTLPYKKINNIVSDRKIVDFINCPICYSSKIQDLFIKWGFVHSNCKNCDHIFVRNQLNKKTLMKIYDKSLVDNAFIKRRSKISLLTKYWNKVYTKYAELYLKKNSKILDVGCGNGEFLDILKKKFNYEKIFGSGFSSDQKNYLKKLLGNSYFHKMDLNQINKTKIKFDVITFWGVVEHLKNPLETIQMSKKILEKDGMILILVPNLRSRAFKLLGVNTPTLNPREHLHFFTSKSMNYLAKKTNFRIVEFHQELPVIDLMYPYINFNKKVIDEILKKKESYYHVYLLKNKI